MSTTPNSSSNPTSPSQNKKKANVSSKIGSLNGLDKPTTSPKTPRTPSVIKNQKTPDYSKVQSKIGSKDNLSHTPKGGDKKIYDEKVKVEAKSKVGSLDNLSHTPKGGDKKIYDEKVKVEAKAKIGSKDNIGHTPKGGDVKIYDEKVKVEAKAKIGSKDSKIFSGEKKIYDEKVKVEAKAKIGSKDV
ncbi:hypothetical protein HK099_001631, partial [Clydaea vesicula]